MRTSALSLLPAFGSLAFGQSNLLGALMKGNAQDLFGKIHLAAKQTVTLEPTIKDRPNVLRQIVTYGPIDLKPVSTGTEG